jgi:hypothetical protein
VLGVAEGVRAWRVVRVFPHSGQISNVSAFVLPERMPVADDRHEQLHMFPGDQRVDLLIHLLDDAVGAVKSLSELNRELLQNATLRRLNDDPAELTRFYDEAIGTYKSPKPKRTYTPQIKERRTWAGFRAEVQHTEAKVRRDTQLRATDEVTYQQIFDAGGPHRRTIQRILVKNGLPKDLWPPRTWPEDLANL